MHMLVRSIVITTQFTEEPDTGKVLDVAIHEISSMKSQPT